MILALQCPEYPKIALRGRFCSPSAWWPAALRCFFKQARGKTRLFCEVGSVTKSAAGKKFRSWPPWVYLWPPEVNLRWSPLVHCTNADDSMLPCEPGDFYSRSSLACEECIPVEGAASVLCTTDSDSVPTSAAEGWYFTPDGGFAGTVTRCTPIEGASSVSCSHLVAITNSVVVSCDNDLELIDGTCVDNRSTTIDCDAVDVSLPCNVMALVAQLREAAAHDVLLIEVIDPVTFCPCKAVLDASPDWTPNVVQSCDGGN
jgi:hypothetical protein